MQKAAEIVGFVFRALVAGLAIAFVIVYLWPTLNKSEAETTTENGDGATSGQPAATAP